MVSSCPKCQNIVAPFHCCLFRWFHVGVHQSMISNTSRKSCASTASCTFRKAAVRLPSPRRLPRRGGIRLVRLDYKPSSQDGEQKCRTRAPRTYLSVALVSSNVPDITFATSSLVQAGLWSYRFHLARAICPALRMSARDTPAREREREVHEEERAIFKLRYQKPQAKSVRTRWREDIPRAVAPPTGFSANAAWGLCGGRWRLLNQSTGL